MVFNFYSNDIKDPQIKSTINLAKKALKQSTFECTRKFIELNQKQKVSVIVILNAIALQTGEQSYFVGPGGCGKSEAVKVVLPFLQDELTVSTPTGNLAKDFCANTYFTNLNINPHSRTNRNESIELIKPWFKNKTGLLFDECYSISVDKLHEIYDK